MLTIEKRGNKNFNHIDSNPVFKDYSANDVKIEFNGTNVRLRSLVGGVILRREGYELADVRVINLGGAPEQFTSISDLEQRLINLGYPFQGGTNVVNGVESVVAGINVTVDATDPQNPIVSAGDGATPTIQEVLTKGNVVDLFTSLNFDMDDINTIVRLFSVDLGTQKDFYISRVDTETDASLTRTKVIELQDDKLVLRYRVGATGGLGDNTVELNELQLSLNGGSNFAFKGLIGNSDFSANYAALNNAYGQVGFINGYVETESLTGTKNIDWNRREAVGNYTLTGATTLTETNLKPRVLEFVITGDFALTLPSTWEAYPSNDTYDGTVKNHIVVTCIDNTAASEIVFYTLTNMPT